MRKVRKYSINIKDFLNQGYFRSCAYERAVLTTNPVVFERKLRRIKIKIIIIIIIIIIANVVNYSFMGRL